MYIWFCENGFVFAVSCRASSDEFKRSFKCMAACEVLPWPDSILWLAI